MTNTMTTMKIWMATPMAAFPAYPTKCPTRARSTIPWSPPMRFCSIVGQASIQTARASGPSTMERSRSLPPPLGIQAPRPRARGRDVEPNEAVDHGGRALIEDCPEAVRPVPDEIGDRHLAGQQKGDGTGEQPDEEEQTSEGLQDASQAEQRGDGHCATAGHDGARKREQLGRSELHEDEGRDDPEDAVQARRRGAPATRQRGIAHESS